MLYKFFHLEPNLLYFLWNYFYFLRCAEKVSYLKNKNITALHSENLFRQVLSVLQDLFLDNDYYSNKTGKRFCGFIEEKTSGIFINIPMEKKMKKIRFIKIEGINIKVDKILNSILHST
jgi:hypothetical protein